MATWTSAGLNLKGPKGDKGDPGEPGQSVTIQGSVATSADLPTTGQEAGDGWITQDDGHLHVWDGDSWNDVGTVRGPEGAPGEDGRGISSVSVDSDGIVTVYYTDGTSAQVGNAKGPKGDPGADGDTGPAGQRGSLWFTGHGAPSEITGAQVGDLYLDVDDGTVFTFTA